IWALMILRKPEVEAAFLARRAKSQPTSFLQTTTGWAILYCLLGVLSTLLPWRGPLPWNDPSGRELPGAISTEEGATIAVAFMALGLLLFITYTGAAVRVWKPLVLVVAGCGITLFLSEGVWKSHPLAGAYLAF